LTEKTQKQKNKNKHVYSLLFIFLGKLTKTKLINVEAATDLEKVKKRQMQP
jgi:hypothetical protein